MGYIMGKDTIILISNELGVAMDTAPELNPSLYNSPENLRSWVA